MGSGMVVMEEPAAKGQLQLFSSLVTPEVVELFIIGGVGAFYPAVQSWGPWGYEAVAASQGLYELGHRVFPYRSIQRGLWASGVPMGEDGVVIGLDHLDGEGEGGQGILQEAFGGVDGQLLMDLDHPKSSMAIDGGVLIQPSALHQVREVFDVHLEQVSRAGHQEDPAVSFGLSLMPTYKAAPFKHPIYPEGAGDAFEAHLALKDLPQPQRSQMAPLPKSYDEPGHPLPNASGRTVGLAGAVQKGVWVIPGLLKTSAPFVEGLARDPQLLTGQADVLEPLRLFKPVITLTNNLFWRNIIPRHG